MSSRSRVGVLLFFFLAGCDLFGGSEKERSPITASEADAMCVRDLPALDRLDREPKACTGTAQCPRGSYCHTATGTCEWQCRKSADCPNRGVCGCDGRCLPENNDVPTTPTQDPSCPRNPELLSRLLPNASGEFPVNGGYRICRFNDECPNGSHCDQKVGHCSYECVASTGCTPDASGAARSCDCFGRCVAATPAKSAPRIDLPILALEPAVIWVDPPSTGVDGAPEPTKPALAGPREVTIRLRTPTLTRTMATPNGPQPQLRVSSSRWVSVRCGPRSEIPTEFGRGCDVPAQWTWTQVGDGYEAVRSVFVWNRDEPPGRDDKEKAALARQDETLKGRWWVRVTSPDVAEVPASVALNYRETPRPGIVSNPIPETVQGTFKGDVTVRVLEKNDVGVAAFKPLIVVGVTAELHGEGSDRMLWINDQSLTLSGSPLFPIELEPFLTPNRYPFWRDPSLGKGEIFQQISTDAIEWNDNAKRITARVAVLPELASLPGPLIPGVFAQATLELQISLTLDPLARSCTTFASRTALACETGQVCRRGACVTSDEPDELFIGAVFSQPTMVPRLITEWFDKHLRLTSVVDLLWSRFPGTNEEALVCGPEPTSDPLFRRRFDLGAGPFSVSGDLPCVGRNYSVRRHWTVPLPQMSDDLPTLATEKLPAPELLAECLTELSRSSDSQIFGSFGAVARCTDVSRVLGLLYVLRPGERSLYAPGSATADQIRRMDKVYLNVLRQWAEGLGFVARQGLEEVRLRSTLISATSDAAKTDRAAWDSSATLPKLIEVLEQGWLVPLQAAAGDQTYAHLESPTLPTSRFTAGERGLGVIDAASLASPDYRLEYDPSFTSEPGHEQPNGPVPAILEGLSLYLDVVEAHLEDVGLRTAQVSLTSEALRGERLTALQTAGRALRAAVALGTLSQALFDRAKTAGVVGWESRFHLAYADYVAARRRLAARIGIVVEGRNSLNIGEDDLPLFFGDLTGPNSRFFASSDYLLNTWAQPAVAAAATSLQSARDAWIAARNSTLQDVLSGAERERRLESLRAQYGGAAVRNCGISDREAKDVLDDPTFNPTTCFLAPTCTFDGKILDKAGPVNEALKALQGKPFDYLKCRLGELKARYAAFGPQIPMTPKMDACWARDIADWALTLQDPTGGELVSLFNVSCGDVLFDATQLWTFRGFDLIPEEERAAIDAKCEALHGLQPFPTPDYDTKCYRGEIGTAFARIVSARKEVNAAMKRMNATTVAASEKEALCLQMEMDDADRSRALDTLKKFRNHWAKTKGVARAVENIAASVEGVASAAVAVVTGDVGGVIKSIGGIFGKRASSKKERADDQLRQAEANYQDLLTNQARAQSFRACIGEYNGLKAQIDADVAVIEARAADVDVAVVQFENLIGEVEQQVMQGKAAAAREEARPFEGMAHHYWLDEKKDKFQQDFDWAKRLTFLAMRAIEYDFQQSLSLRTRILTAQHPDQLAAAIRTMQTEMAGRTINRRRPEESSIVISVRDDVLGLQDFSDLTNGERNWTPATRFRERLAHPSFATFDESGKYVGQGVRFSLDPNAGAGTGGVALANRCAERLWRVTATIQGDGLSGREPGAPVLLLKGNTFQSQWCAGQETTERFQTASLQPSRQLFRPDDVAAPIDQSKAFTAAALFPWFNVRRSDFYKKQYQDGASEELAGRGLYGDYIMLFPKELVGKGFPLDKVEDVLLRIDYLSIDNLPTVRYVGTSSP